MKGIFKIGFNHFLWTWQEAGLKEALGVGRNGGLVSQDGGGAFPVSGAAWKSEWEEELDGADNIVIQNGDPVVIMRGHSGTQLLLL